MTEEILGIGTHIVEVVRIGELIARQADLFLRKIYTDEEIRHCQRRQHATQHFAGHWCAKESVLQVLGHATARPNRWRDIEIIAARSGRPDVELHGGARELAEQLGVVRWQLALSWCRAYATATVVALGRPAN